MSRNDILAAGDSLAGARRGRIQFRLEYGALRALDLAARALPLDVASRLSGLAWRLAAPWLGRHRRADRNLALMMPDTAEDERRRILRAMWRNLGETFLEALQLDRLAADPRRIVLDDSCRIAVRRAVAEGAIIVSPHLGNWEAAVLPLAAAAGSQHVGVYRPAKNPLVNAYVLAIRRRHYTGGLVEKGDRAAWGLLRQARQGGSLGFMADLRDGSGVSVPFFGRLAPSTAFPAMLARQFRRPVFAVCLVRVATGRFRMEAEEIVVGRTSDRAADILAATAAMQRTFEQWIRRWPEQWMWAHQRYERRPALLPR